MAYSEYAMENINIEESKILFEERWYSLEELKSNIKSKVNSEDFNVANLSHALQELNQALNNITTVKLTLHIDLIKKYKELSQNQGSTFESVLRDALITRVDHGLTSNMSDKAGSAKSASGGAKEPAYKPKKVACRKCKAVIVVESQDRPITITCPECGTPIDANKRNMNS